jgi:lipid-A-disaccharide synthase
LSIHRIGAPRRQQFSMAEKVKIMIVTGEASGDLHGAKLVRAIRESAPETGFDFFGAAGHRLREAGVDPVVNSDDFSIVGLAEIARALPMFLRAFADLKRAAIALRPDVVILVDFPDFNLKLAKSLKKQGLKIVYYISPQFWAWRKYRARTIRKFVDLMITVLPFEKDWYEKQGISHVEYVGSPVAREVHADKTKEEFCASHGLDPARPIVALLAGSRHKEMARILPPMLETAALMAHRDYTIQFVIPLAPMRSVSEVEEAKARLKGLVLPGVIKVVTGETYDALKASDAAAVTSGTATLETAILGTPMAIVYKTSVLNYSVLRPLISVEHFGLINLIAGERLAKEFIQGDFTPENLAAELFRLLDPAENLRMRRRLGEVTDTLGHGGASKRAAKAILNLIRV